MSSPAEVDLRLRRLENDRDDDYSELANLSRAIDAKVDRVDQKVDRLDAKVDTLVTEMAGVKTEMATVKGTLADHGQQLAEILALLQQGR